MLRKEIRSLHHQIAQTVLSDKLAKHGTNLPDDATGNQIRRAVGLMDTPITEALEKTFAIFARIGMAWLTYATDETDRTARRMQSSDRRTYCKLLIGFRIGRFCTMRW